MGADLRSRETGRVAEKRWLGSKYQLCGTGNGVRPRRIGGEENENANDRGYKGKLVEEKWERNKGEKRRPERERASKKGKFQEKRLRERICPRG